MPKDYWIASEQFLNGVGKPLANVQKNHKPIGEKAELLSGYWQKRGNFHPFSLKCHISVYIY
jgi:hypothetical protein